jgi:hypothetical protein
LALLLLAVHGRWTPPQSAYQLNVLEDATCRQANGFGIEHPWRDPLEGL